MTPRLISVSTRALAALFVGLLTRANFVHAQQLPAFTQVIVFGDSLSDTGNVWNRIESQYLNWLPRRAVQLQRRSLHE